MAANADSMDLDFDDDAEIARMNAQAAEINALPNLAQEQVNDMQDVNGVEEGAEEGEVASSEPVATKIYIEVSNDYTLTSQDLSNLAQDTYYSDDFRAIEWINDTSAKIAYATAHAADEALAKLSAEPANSPLDLRRAVKLTTHPHVELFVRQAVVTDMKEPGAAKRSKFYDAHPAYRPDHSYRGRGPRRGGFGRGGPRRGGRFGGGNSRPGSREGPEFTENLYDDDEASLAARRDSQNRRESEGDLFAGRRREPRRREEDLMAGRNTGRLRDRSASPLRDGDGRFGFSEDQPRRQTARRRTPPPPRHRSRDDNEQSRKSMRQDLFAGKKPSTALTNGQNGDATELFPSKVSRGKELFPEKVGHKYGDEDDSDASRAFSSFNFRNQTAPGSYQPASRAAQNGRNRNGTGQPDLFDRGGPGMSLNGSQGRLKDDFDGGISIKGAGNGFSIRGASQEAFNSDDLFPNKKKARDAQRWQGGFS